MDLSFPMCGSSGAAATVTRRGFDLVAAIAGKPSVDAVWDGERPTAVARQDFALLSDCNIALVQSAQQTS
jgi:hypothetical protein